MSGFLPYVYALGAAAIIALCVSGIRLSR